METERGSPVPREAETPKKEVQLRVTPSEVKFLDTLAGRVYRLPITVHNLGRCNQKIRFQEPLKPQVIHSGGAGAGLQDLQGSENSSSPGRPLCPGE